MAEETEKKGGKFWKIVGIITLVGVIFAVVKYVIKFFKDEDSEDEQTGV